MSIALIGIALTQLIWIKAQVDLDEKNFDDRVYMALNNVKAQLKSDTDTKDFVEQWIKSKKSIFGKNESLLNEYISSNKRSMRSLAIESALQQISPEYLLESIDRNKLDNYLRVELADQGIKIKYDYGIFSNATNEFIIRNGVFAVPLVGDASSEIRNNKGLENSPYKVSLFLEEGSPGHLRIFFPNKRSFLWAQVLPSMLTSFLFTGIVVFCFAYTIYVILRQKKVSEMKTDFINNMTHEFKTPIATISLAADSITNDSVVTQPDKVSRFAGIIKQENKRMLDQVEKVLQMARIDKQDFQLNLTEVNINTVVYKAAENSRLKIAKRQGVLTTELDAQSPVIRADVTHISNIVYNLLDNAEKYSTDIPEILISTRNVKDGVELIVSDKGIGMSKEAIKHIFDKFYRVHTGNRHDVKGFGLGLSYVKALVSAHNGTISVDSELDKGSTFTAFFPFKCKGR
jgi:two-component system, OmpR family, phosphate regulon sensor histidine kinase PhoR